MWILGRPYNTVPTPDFSQPVFQSNPNLTLFVQSSLKLTSLMKSLKWRQTVYQLQSTCENECKCLHVFIARIECELHAYKPLRSNVAASVCASVMAWQEHVASAAISPLISSVFVDLNHLWPVWLSRAPVVLRTWHQHVLVILLFFRHPL